MLNVMDGTRVKAVTPQASPGRSKMIPRGRKGTITLAPEKHRHVFPWQIVWDRVTLPKGVFYGVREGLAAGIEILEPCAKCGRDVLREEIVWMERDHRGRYHEPGTLSPEAIEGSYALGKDCAQKLRKNSRGST